MEEEIAETEYCSNCRRDIPAANYVMHVTHCQRNLTLCKACGEPVPTSQLEEHFEENHTKVKCECGEQVEKMNFEEHKEKDCPCRLVKCQFCDLEIAFSELLSHTEYCGSRTEKCEICDRYVQKKDLEVHMETGCQYPVKEEKKSVPSKRPADKVSPEMPIGLLHAMGLGGSSETSTDAEDYFRPIVAGMREFGRILNTGLGTPPFNSTTRYFGDFAAVDAPVDGRGVIARGATRGMARPSFDHPSTDDFEYVDVDYTEQFSDDDDEMLAAACQADEFDNVNGTYEKRRVDEPFPDTQSSRPLADLTNDTTQLPCEFCGQLLPLESLILHQSGCQLKSMDSYPGSGSADIFFDGTPMYTVPRRINSTDVFHEDVVANHRQPTGEDNEDDADATFLPCEFCRELLPYDNLIMHQAVCDAGPPSLAPTPVFNGSAQPPMNNARPQGRGARSRPSRPVYERKKSQTPIQNFIPKELDDFGPDSLDVTRNENGLYREKDSHTPMNNEVPRRINRDRALDGETLVIRNTDDAAAKQQLPKKISGDGAQAMIRNNELTYRQPRKEEFRAQSVAVDQPGKGSSELQNGFTSASHQASAVKPLGRGMIQSNTGATRKPADEQARHFSDVRTHGSNHRVKASKRRVVETSERSKRDVDTKVHNQAHKSDNRPNKPRRNGVNEVSAADVRSAVPRRNKTNFKDSYKTVDPSSSSITHQMPSNPRRNPATFKVEEIPMNRGRGQAQGATSESQASKGDGIVMSRGRGEAQGTASESQASHTRASLSSKSRIKKKVV